jgi:cytoskeleton protein RodZ
MTEQELDMPIDPGLTEMTSGPGYRLRQARERKGLDIGEVSDRLHLPPRLVSAIENDDYADLPGTVFTQGYLRNYARLVDESPDEILTMFTAVRPRDEYKPALRQFQLPMKANQVNSSHGLVKTMTWLVIIALLILLIVWWRGYIKLAVPMLGEDEVTDTMAGDENGRTLSLPAAPMAEPGSREVAGPEEDGLTGAEEARPDAMASGESASREAIPLVANDNADDEPAEARTAAVEPVSPAAGEEGMPAGAGAAAQQPDADGQGRSTNGDGGPAENEVALVFGAPCWVDIRDAAGEKILFGGIDAGETVRLAGSPPYQVVLGNSSAVTITVGGKPYPVDGHSRGNVARFVLDPAKALMAANGPER